MQNLTMRVVGGKYIRRQIQFDPNNTGTRPTKDMVRQGIFNALGETVKDRIALDLFSGTGALGIEAISRGARTATFVDQARNAIQLIQTNTQFLEEPYEIVQLDYKRFLANAKKSSFDLVLLDPPYLLDIEAILTEVLTSGILKDDAILVLESNKPLSITLEHSKIRTYKYGITYVAIIWRTL